MKAALLVCAMANCAFAAVPIVARITPDALAKLQQESPMALLPPPPAKGESNVRRPEAQSIIKQSLILNDGKNWTLIPKGAVLFLPEAMKCRVDVKPSGPLLVWRDFLARNQAWITTNDISFDQATGKKPLQAERVAFWPKQDKVVIATHQNGPITVRVSKETQAPATL
jgi:hypothetical protein